MKYCFIVILALVMNGCSLHFFDSTNARQPGQSQLYQEVGGNEGIARITDAFIKKIASDPDILPYFAKSSVSHFRQGFISHLCTSVNGPCEYNGDSMVDIHTGMNIDEKDFNRVVELLIAAMEDEGIGYSTQNKVLKALAPLRSDIIHY